VVYDLGCGDGRIVVAAAKKYGCRAVGFDLDRRCLRQARELVKQEKAEALVRIEEKDLFTVDLRGADVVTLYLSPTLNAKLLPQLEKMKPGSRIVSHAFAMPGAAPDKVVTVTSEEDGLVRKLYRWTTPWKQAR
jgi:ribosomal protein L11 methylase PrmA